VKELQRARQVFMRREPRNLFYRVATELVTLTLKRKTALSVTEALAVLLQTWNSSYYRFRPFDEKHFLAIEGLLSNPSAALTAYRRRSIDSLSPNDATAVSQLFAAFEGVLGPVGAAKCLHLLAPRFFPLWDRPIAHKYGLTLRPRESNAGRYLTFMEITKEQCERLGAQGQDRDLLKALDEYNYCRHSRGWM